MIITRQCSRLAAVVATGMAATMFHSASVMAGGFAFAGTGSVTHPEGYNGSGGQVDVNVCIVPGTEFASEMEQSIRNNIAVWNKLQSTSANIRAVPLPANTFDFESVSLHELGHCIGIAHPNVGFDLGVGFTQTNFSASTRGPNGFYQFNAGPDGLPGTADDIRGDDVSLNYVYSQTNNPFSEQAIVDSSTYSQDISLLPGNDAYAVNADREVATTPRFALPNTEAVMQQGTFNDEIQRTLGHDDVSTLRYGMSGLDGVQGSGDDYSVNLVYGGISAAGSCNINVAMDATETGFAVCALSGFLLGNNVVISSANMFYDPNDDWYFTDSPPCEESVDLEANTWQMISLPCQVGISTSATVEDVLADDLGAGGLNTDWAVFSYDYTDQGGGLMQGAYNQLGLSDEMESTKGYWIITRDSGITIDVQGEYNSQMDTALHIDSAAGSSFGWNLVGMPYRFPVIWADVITVDPVGEQLSLLQADPTVGESTACSETGPNGPLPECKLGRRAFSFNTAIADYDILTPSSGALDKFAAAWVYVGDSGHKLRFPMPSAELSTP